MTRGDLATARLHRDWLRNLPRLTGKPLTRIAKEIKIAPSTLTRPLSEGEDGASTLHARTIAKIVAHTGAPPPPTLTGSPPLGSHTLPGFGTEATPFSLDDNDPLSAAVKALIGGRNAVTAWTLRTRALELAGFLPGDIVLVDLGATPQPGDAVYAVVKDWSRRSEEAVMRIFEPAGTVRLLVARSSDPETQRTLVVDDEKVTVKGVLLPHRLRAAR